MDKIDAGGTDDHNAARSSSCPPAVGSNMAGNDMLGDNFAAYKSPESYIPSYNAFESFLHGNFVAVDNPREHDACGHEAPHHQARGDQARGDYILNDHKVGQGTPELYIGVGDVHGQGKPDTYMQVDGAGDERTPGNSLLNPITIHDIISLYNRPLKFEESEEVALAMNAGPNDTAPTQMHKFMRLPTEIRLMIWEMAMEDAKEPDLPVFKRCVQRFRFNLAYDARRVKPGQDKSRGWVACFTPLRVNANQSLKFLRASVDSRALLLRKMSVLTVHELPIGADGQYMAPRKCHMPFNFAKDDFCLEGITHGFEEAERNKADKDAVWDPEKLPLADLLDNALGLRFAPRIKRLSVVPQSVDVDHGFDLRPFIESVNGRNMAVLAKRFPALVTVKSVIPQKHRPCASKLAISPYPCYFLCKAASLRGKNQGGPSGMSKEDREALFDPQNPHLKLSREHWQNERWLVISTEVALMISP
ncbi:hypothetical protein INS49_003360 [Diaporthe citri]|uniref:uncharacterized protein n=1 Tax=Diaporthe citri TaxID=83186 RepID=UPI001C81112A|nr:uncharacterized protein INS49_003360 [Diaporthe citri]KAG6355398.1 hypothetical protein INS49_003360 [Diaporthe citri]